MTATGSTFMLAGCSVYAKPYFVKDMFEGTVKVYGSCISIRNWRIKSRKRPRPSHRATAWEGGSTRAHPALQPRAGAAGAGRARQEQSTMTRPGAQGKGYVLCV